MTSKGENYNSCKNESKHSCLGLFFSIQSGIVSLTLFSVCNPNNIRLLADGFVREDKVIELTIKLIKRELTISNTKLNEIVLIGGSGGEGKYLINNLILTIIRILRTLQ